MRYDVLVIGGGAAGIFAAWRASTLGAKVLLLEKNDKIGIKILISGGGKCNITHDCSVQELLHAFRRNEGAFLKSACYRFRNTEVVQMLESRGLEVYTRPDGRIFPVDGTAKDVVRILGEYLDEASVEVRVDSPVVKLTDGGAMLATGEEVAAKAVVVAVGGASYPKTGTTGDGYAWMREIGHRVLPIRPALAPILMESDERWAEERAGIALRDCLLKASQGKEIARWRGDLLFTHTGVSGPTVLGISRVVAEALLQGKLTLEVDLTPDRPHEKLSQEVLEFAKAHPKRAIASYVATLVPDRLVDKVFDAAACDPTTIAGQLPAKSRNRLVEVLKAWPLGTVRAVPMERGEVVAGGVSLYEVNPGTMESLKRPGLFLCGEILDIAGPVGGYNLQAAFSTGFVAGEAAAKAVLA